MCPSGNIGAQPSNIISSVSSGFQSSPRLNLRLYLDLVDAGNTGLCEVTPGGWMRVLAFQKDGDMFAAGGSSNLEIWNYRTGDPSVKMEKMTGLSVDSLAINQDGTLLAAGTSDQKIYIFDAKTGRRILPLEGHQSMITALANGARLLVVENRAVPLVSIEVVLRAGPAAPASR